MSLDIVDVTGVHMMNLDGKLSKNVLNEQGNVVRTMDGLDKTDTSLAGIARAAMAGLEANEGCQFLGQVKIHKVPGNFHISSHGMTDAVKSVYAQGKFLDFSHKINHLSFGDIVEAKALEEQYGESIPNELSGTKMDVRQKLGGDANLYVNYYLDITEAEYKDTTKEVEGKNPTYSHFAYRSMETAFATSSMPAIWFKYNISPVKVNYTLFYLTWSDFLVSLLAIIGGIYAAGGILAALASQGLSVFSAGDERQ